MRVYVASSWRNEKQPAVVKALREAGHEVYDFRSPTPGNTGFSWRKVCAEKPPIPEGKRAAEIARAYGIEGAK